MNDLHDLMRDRLSAEHLDLHGLSDRAIRQGRRIRSVRRAGVGLATAAVAATVGVGVAAIAGHDTGATPQYADGGATSTTGPAEPALHVGQRLHLTPQVTGRVFALQGPHPMVQLVGAVGSQQARRDALVIVLEGPAAAVKRYAATSLDALHATYPDAQVAMAAPVSHATKGHDTTAHVPVRETATGWTCQWFPADDKGACTGPGGALASVDWHPAGEHAAWLDPAKADVMPGVHTFVSPVHGAIFVSIAPAQGATQDDVDALAAGLAWK